MRRAHPIVLTLVLFAATATAPAPARAAAPPEDVSAALASIIEKHRIPGMVAAVVTPDGTVMLGAAGVRRTGSPEKVTAGDRFHIGSCTKAMTATLCAILVEEGKLKWESTPADVWPELKRKFNPEFAKVTLEQFLHHRSGLPSDTAPEEVHRAMRQFRGDPRAGRLKLVEMALSKAPATPAGAKHVYTNAGYTIAGAMCEKVAGKAYEALIRERLFAPLGITTAGFGAPGSAAKIDQPRGHDRAGKPVEPGPNADNPAPYSPSGRAYMSVDDWGKFVALHLRGAKGDTPLLKRASFEKLHEPVGDGDVPYAGGWIAAPRGWAGGTALTHNGTNTYWFAVTWLAPQRGFAVLVACNTGAEGSAQACDDAASALIQKYLATGRRD
jgi:CubicO group peptidase (beta-lactamase class C family)